MIFTYLATLVITVLSTLFGLFTLPAFPLVVTQAISNVLDWLSIPLGVINNYVGGNYLSGIFVVLLGYLLLKPAIYIGIWIYQRVRG